MEQRGAIMKRPKGGFFDRKLAGVAVLILVIAVGCGDGTNGITPTASPDELQLETYDAGFFTIEKPVGWDVTIAGGCTTLALLIRDPDEPLRQIFFFGTAGPVYLCQDQRALDEWYVANGGYPHTWLDAPVIDPFTPENYLAHWPAIADMAAATAFMPRFPRLEDLALIASESLPAMLPDASTCRARGLFADGGEVGEGMFLATVKVLFPYTGQPGGGNGYGHCVCGVTAPEGEFAAVADRLVTSLNGFTISQDYVDDCIEQSQQVWGAVAAAGQTLSEASDMIWEGWQARTHSEDISAEQWTDAYRNVERVYDPDTGTVYEVPSGWYEAYDLDRAQYEMSGLQSLPPDAWELWMQAALDGAAGIH